MHFALAVLFLCGCGYANIMNPENPFTLEDWFSLFPLKLFSFLCHLSQIVQYALMRVISVSYLSFSRSEKRDLTWYLTD